jgi:signal transduction histidine kinase
LFVGLQSFTIAVMQFPFALRRNDSLRVFFMCARHAFALALLAFVCGTQAKDAAAVQHFTQAHLVQGRQLSIDASTPTIELPHNWDNERPQRQGQTTYRIDFTVSGEQAQEVIAIYMPRIGNRYELFINDELVHSTGNLSDQKQFYTDKASLTKLPKSAVFKGLNTLKIVLAGEAGRYAGLSSVSIGDYETLSKAYEQRQWFQSFGILALVTICLFISFITILYGYLSSNKYSFIFGIGALAWALNNSYLLLNYFPLNYRIALFFYDFFYALAIVLVLITLARMVKLRYKWFENVAYGYLYFTFFILVIYHDGYPIARTIFLDSFLVLGFVSFALYIKTLLQRRDKLWFIVFITLLLVMLLAVYDQLYIYRQYNAFEMITYSRYCFILFVMAIATSLASQFLRVNAFVHKSRARMDSKLKIVKGNLSEAYARRSMVEKKLTLQQERFRLMQDMHDGLGHRLISLQQAVQDPKQSGPELNQLVKQTIAELRNTIQSISQTHDNVSFMLGDLRERLEFLCIQFKKQLHWSVDEMPRLPYVDEFKIANIEKIILEIFSNIAKHSNASVVTLTATFVPHEAITIVVTENGAGFAHALDERDPKDKPLGLLGIQRRALDIQAALLIEQKGKTIRLIIPTH